MLKTQFFSYFKIENLFFYQLTVINENKRVDIFPKDKSEEDQMVPSLPLFIIKSLFSIRVLVKEPGIVNKPLVRKKNL